MKKQEEDLPRSSTTIKAAPAVGGPERDLYSVLGPDLERDAWIPLPRRAG